MNTFKELFENEVEDKITDFDREVMSLESKIIGCKDANEKLQLQHQLEKLLYQKENKSTVK